MNPEYRNVSLSFRPEYDEDMDELLSKLNGLLTRDISIIAKKTNGEIKAYYSRSVERIIFSTNFGCYIFILKSGEIKTTALIEFFDAIGDLN